MKLFTNRPEFYNDICEEIRLFLPREEIELGCDEAGFEKKLILVYTPGNELTAKAEYFDGGDLFSHTHRIPAVPGDEIVEKRYAKRCMKSAVYRVMRMAFPDKLIPWGSLTGIRPTRLLRELTDTFGTDEADRLMLEEFDVSERKLALAKEINSVQAPVFASAEPNEFGVYVGVPFCRTRCLYCSFASQIRTKKTDMAPYLDALKRDVSMGAQMARDKGLVPRSFYMGGGTPTILTAEELDSVLDTVCSEYSTCGKEFTVEAGRPDTITREKLLVMKAHGVTRVSVNPQTMCDRTLRLVGRDHTSEDIKNCFAMVRDFGFGSINMDLIAGLPGETEREMEESLRAVEELSPDCLTVHTLAIKRASRLHERMDEYALPDVETVERMVEMGMESARRMGMRPYYMYRQKYMAGNLENVGYSMPNEICIYNIDMMEDAMSILAHGAGAMTKRVFSGGTRIERIPNPKDIATYIEKLDTTNAERIKLFDL